MLNSQKLTKSEEYSLKNGFLIWISKVYHYLIPLYAEWQIYYYLIVKAILH